MRGRDATAARAALAQGAASDAVEADGTPALIAAVQVGSLEISKLLVRDATGAVAAGPADFVIGQPSASTLVGALLAKGADVNARSVEGKTALVLAAEKGRSETVRTLLDSGADVDAQDSTGGTPLERATNEGHRDVVTELRRAGADVSRADPTVLLSELHTTSDLFVAAARRGDERLVTSMIDKGVDVDGRSRAGQTALGEASREGRVGVANLLIDHRAPRRARSGRCCARGSERAHAQRTERAHVRGDERPHGRAERTARGRRARRRPQRHRSDRADVRGLEGSHPRDVLATVAHRDAVRARAGARDRRRDRVLCTPCGRRGREAEARRDQEPGRARHPGARPGPRDREQLGRITARQAQAEAIAGPVESASRRRSRGRERPTLPARRARGARGPPRRR